MLKKSLLTISLLTLAGCNTMAVNEPDFNEPDTPEYFDAYLCYGIFDHDKKNAVALIVRSEEHPTVLQTN